jgi:ferredoxin-nitrite reductase
MSEEFTPEQKCYLEGFASGLQIARARVGRDQIVERRSTMGGSFDSADAGSSGPDAAAFAAQNRVLSAGRKLADQEKFKREQHPFDCYDRLKEQAANNAPPSPADNFRWRYYGLFFLAPTQSAYMCRLRIPNGILRHWQFAGVADLAERYGGPYCHVTTRANLQIREIPPKNSVAVIEAIQDLGLCTRGAGADNIFATSPVRRRRASIPRSFSIRGPSPANGISISSTTARSMGCRASSTSVSTAPAKSPCSKTPMTSGFRRSR